MKISSTIGHTPLVKVSERIYAKLENLNPSGSIKDRMAAFIFDEAERKGEIKPGQIVVEATSGNTGIAFSMLAAERGYKMIVVLPQNMSEERKKMIRAYGATIVEVGVGDFKGACQKRDEIARQMNAFVPNQFANPDNRKCHREKTAMEILQQVREIDKDAKICAFVAGTGTGGTLMGVRDGLIEFFPEMKIVAVEPVESAVMSGGSPGIHAIQGIGDGFIPEIVDMSLVNEVIAVTSDESIKRTRRLSQELGFFVGISSGANVVAAERYVEKYRPDGFVVTVLADSQDRYLSMM